MNLAPKCDATIFHLILTSPKEWEDFYPQLVKIKSGEL